MLQTARSAEVRTDGDLAPRLGAVAVAVRTGDRDLEGILALHAARGLDELDLHHRDEIGAAPAAAPAGEQGVAEERREEIRQTAEVEASGPEAAAAQTRLPVAAVQLPRPPLRQHLVRLDDLAESLLPVRA